MRFLLRRLGFFVLTLWAAMTINFLIPHMMPGSPAQVLKAKLNHSGRIASPEQLNALLASFGFDPKAGLFDHYLTYLKDMVTFNWGVSIGGSSLGASVTSMIRQALPWTLGLVGVATIMAFVIGTLIGIVAGWRRGGLLDGIVPPVFVVTSALPYFWVALLAIVLFANGAHALLPNDGNYDLGLHPEWSVQFIGSVLKHAILPAGTILITAIGGWILTMRNNTITVLTEDYVRMARAKGLRPWRIMWTYAGRNAILPNLTGFAMSLGFVVAGAILVEFVFNYPGVGWMFLHSVESEDYALMQGLFLLITVTVLTAILAADVATVILDPRTRDER